MNERNKETKKDLRRQVKTKTYPPTMGIRNNVFSLNKQLIQTGRGKLLADIIAACVSSPIPAPSLPSTHTYGPRVWPKHVKYMFEPLCKAYVLSVLCCFVLWLNTANLKCHGFKACVNVCTTNILEREWMGWSIFCWREESRTKRSLVGGRITLAVYCLLDPH